MFFYIAIDLISVSQLFLQCIKVVYGIIYPCLSDLKFHVKNFHK